VTPCYTSGKLQIKPMLKRDKHEEVVLFKYKTAFRESVKDCSRVQHMCLAENASLSFME